MRVLALYKKGKLDEERWEVEDAICQREIVSHQVDKAQLTAQLARDYYTPEYLADVKAACEAIALGFDHFTKEEKRSTYELLDLTARLAVEDGYKVAHAECVIDAQRLVIGAVKAGGIASHPSRW